MRLGRTVIALVMLALSVWLFTGASAAVAVKLGWIARLQLFPLILGCATWGIVCWFLVTAIFGRIYCSTVCPMGLLQDVAAKLPRMRHGWDHEKPYHYAAPNSRTRWAVLLIVALCALFGIASVVALLDPYSAFGRIASEIFKPALQLFIAPEVAVASWWAFFIAVVTLAVIWIAAALRGRWVCNTLCPVGTTLGAVSDYSLFHFDIDTDLCVNCRKCEHVCKSQCINLNDHVVDDSRCVVCFDCSDVCPEDAIRYTIRRKQLAIPMMKRIDVGKAASSAASAPQAPAEMSDSAASSCDSIKKSAAPVAGNGATGSKMLLSRRQFMAAGLIMAAGSAIDAARSAGSTPERHLRPISPPGKISFRDFQQKCTACGLCVSHCPSGVLRPSMREYGLLHTMQPLLRYTPGHCCDYDCTVCTDICPTGALEPLTVEEKHIFIIGEASVDSALCVGCGRCAFACPRKVITMTTVPGRRPVATVAEHGCIGCGKCESVCPVRPLTAIAVDGLT